MATHFQGEVIRVQPGPANYWSGPGAIGHLEELYSAETLAGAVWISGTRARAAAEGYLPPSFHASPSRQVAFAGHSTHELVDALCECFGASATLAVGIGGGAALDTAKALGAALDIPFVAIPTIAATCAAFTPLSVWYAADGHALGYEIFKRAAEAVLVEPRILLNAPAEYLQAGLADTLAKWYEAEILCAREDSIPHTAQLGLGISKTLRDLLLTKGASAFEAMRNGELTDDFVAVVDAILAGGGLVGGLGERYTRIAAAHAVHNGLSVLPEAARHLHGMKVAYGLLVQTALLGKRDELARLAVEFRTLGLPVSLGDLGIDARDQVKIEAFVEATLVPHESIHLLPFPVDRETLTAAVHLVEEVAAAL